MKEKGGTQLIVAQETIAPGDWSLSLLTHPCEDGLSKLQESVSAAEDHDSSDVEPAATPVVSEELNMYEPLSVRRGPPFFYTQNPHIFNTNIRFIFTLNINLQYLRQHIFRNFYLLLLAKVFQPNLTELFVTSSSTSSSNLI